MQNRHERIAEDYEEVFLSDGIGMPGERAKLLRLLLSREDHVSAADLAAASAAAGMRLSERQTAAILEQFVRYGLANRVRTGPGEVRYEHAHLGKHHDHVVCVRCGRVLEVELPVTGVFAEVSGSTGFRALHAHIEIHGLCPDCQDRKPVNFPLSQAGAGDRLRVVGVRGGREMRQRLQDMGLSEGVELVVLSAGRGPATVRVGETRMAIGHGMCEKVWVEPAETRDRLDDLPTPEPAIHGAGQAPPPASAGTRTLADLQVGDEATIVRIGGDPTLRQRLLDMGATRGTRIRVERRAPLGDPIEVTVKGYLLAIRASEGRHIDVE